MRSNKDHQGASSSKKHTYLQMVQVAILTLNERGGSSRQEIWKCVDSRFPEANHKQYLLAMRKLRADGSAIVTGKNKNRFTLEPKFKAKALKRMKDGMPLKMVLSPKNMQDLVKRKMKKAAKKKPARKAKKGKRQQSRAKRSAASVNKGKGRKGASMQGKKKGAAASAKDKAKAKAKMNKKTEGSHRSKAKVADKRKTADKKMKAATKANTN